MPTTPDLPTASVAPRQGYVVGEADWKVERFDLLAAHLPELTPEQLPAFHLALAADARRWWVARRLWGIMPLVPQPGMDLADDFRVWKPAEVKADLGLDEKGLKAELAAIGGLWLARGRSDGRTARAAAVEKAGQAAAFREELALPAPEDEDAELRRHGFRPKMFEVKDRAEADNVQEKRMFLARVRAVAKPLAMDSVGPLVRRLLLTQLDLERAQTRYYELAPDDGLRKARLEERHALQDEERSINEQLSKLAPWWFNTGGTEVAVSASFTMFVEGVQRLKAQDDPRLLQAIGEVSGLEVTSFLVDGVHDAEEITGLMRLSEGGIKSGQCPQYDLPWVAYLNMTRERFWDPRYAPLFDAKLLARLRRWLPERWIELSRDDRAHIPALSADGPEGEYKDALTEER